MRLPTTVKKRGVAPALLLGIIALVVACDAVVPPITIHNSTSDDVTINFLYTDNGPNLTFGAQKGDPLSESLDIPSGGSTRVLIGEVEQRQYNLVVKNSADEEISRRTFLPEELDDRNWRITITPEGIR